MGSPWKIHRESMGNPWQSIEIYGKPMGSYGESREIPGNLWENDELPDLSVNQAYSVEQAVEQLVSAAQVR